MSRKEIIDWLLDGDVAIQYQVHRDLKGNVRPDLQQRMIKEGWGPRFLKQQKADGHWGDRYYQPKWISTHYTLCDLRVLCFPQDFALITNIVNKVANEEKGADGGIRCSPSLTPSDVCVNGMFLNFASYFGLEEAKLRSVVDFILSEHMMDGGFNCRSNRSGAKHSSLHTTLSILEGIATYLQCGYTYQLNKLKKAQKKAEEFILLHRFYLSDRTGQIIQKDFLRFAFPRRWKYDVLSALDYFSLAKRGWDPRMQEAVDLLMEKRRADGRWNLNAKHPGQTHIEMERAGQPSRWNTLRALRVLRHFHLN